MALTDALAARYGLPGNDPATSAARRDKVTMAAHLERAGVAAPATFRAQSMDAALAWVAGHDRWPVVLKPAASAGNDKVFFCADLVEVRRAFARSTARKTGWASRTPPSSCRRTSRAASTS
ncbi:MAG: hypothetical protein R3F43_25855 [bacterium]